MIDISKEEIVNKMFFITDEKSGNPIAVIKVSELMKFERPHGRWIINNGGASKFYNPGKHCDACGRIVEFSENFCPKCGSDMRIRRCEND